MKTFQLRDTIEAKVHDNGYYKYTPTNSIIPFNNISLIKQENNQSESVKAMIQEAHQKFQKVFNNDISNDYYNGFYGKHLCILN